MQPDVLPSVPYLLNKVRQGQRSLILWDGHQTVRGDGDCQHRGGREQGGAVHDPWYDGARLDMTADE